MGAGESLDLSLRPAVTIGGTTVNVERLLGEGACSVGCCGLDPARARARARCALRNDCPARLLGSSRPQADLARFSWPLTHTVGSMSSNGCMHRCVRRCLAVHHHPFGSLKCCWRCQGDELLAQAREELRLADILRHPNVIRFVGHAERPFARGQGLEVGLLMEYCPGTAVTAPTVCATHVSAWIILKSTLYLQVARCLMLYPADEAHHCLKRLFLECSFPSSVLWSTCTPWIRL